MNQSRIPRYLQPRGASASASDLRAHVCTPRNRLHAGRREGATRRAAASASTPQTCGSTLSRAWRRALGRWAQGRVAGG
eukprot:scaffold20244_cov109-Isochrysis_galbana.AAC.1